MVKKGQSTSLGKRVRKRTSGNPDFRKGSTSRKNMIDDILTLLFKVRSFDSTKNMILFILERSLAATAIGNPVFSK